MLSHLRGRTLLLVLWPTDEMKLSKGPIEARKCCYAQRMRGLGTLSPKWDVFIKPLPLVLKKLCKGGGRKIVRAIGDGRHQGDSVFQTQQDWCTCELTETVEVSMGPAHVLAIRGPTPGRGSRHKPPCLTKKLSPFDIYTCKGKISFLHWSLTRHTNHT